MIAELKDLPVGSLFKWPDCEGDGPPPLDDCNCIFKVERSPKKGFVKVMVVSAGECMYSDEKGDIYRWSRFTKVRTMPLSTALSRLET